MAESRGMIVQDSDIYHDFACTLCAENDRNVEALKRCEECAENLCGECLRNHMFKAMRRHTLVDKADVGESASLTNTIKGENDQDVAAALSDRDVPNVNCERHPGNRIELYCGDHDAVGCSTCTGLDHKLCEDMHYIPAVAAGFSGTDEHHVQATRVETLIRKSKGLKETGEDFSRQIIEERDEAVDLINERAEFIKIRTEHLKDMAIKDVDDHFKEIEQAVKEDISKSDDVISILETEKEKLNSEICVNESELFIYTKQWKATRAKNEHIIQELETSMIVKEPVEVIVDDTVITCLGKLETLASINNSVQGCQSSDIMSGEVKYPGGRLAAATPLEDSSNHTTSPEKHDCNTQELSFSLQDTPNVRAWGDSDVCGITGCCMLSIGRMIITDVVNKCLKLFDSSFNLLNRRVLQEGPSGGCSVGEHEVAVILYPSGMVNFATITHNNEIHLTHYFKVGKVCRGISYASEKLYISCGGVTSNGEGPGMIRVYTTSGDLLQTIKSTSIQQFPITVPYGISAAKNGQCFISNYGHGVLAVDLCGIPMWRCQHPELTRAAGICQMENSVLVSCINTGNIFEISHTGVMSCIQMHGSTHLNAPRFLSYNEADGRLIVTELDGDCVLVYKRQ